MNINPETNSASPSDDQKTTISTVLVRLFVGLGSGILGSIVLALVLMLSWNIVGDALSPQASEVNEFGVLVQQQSHNPLFLWFILLATFLGSLAATLCHTILRSITESVSFQRATVLTHIFFGQLILLFPLVFVYLQADASLGNAGITTMALIHSTLSIMLLYYTQKIFERSGRLMQAVYGMSLGALFTAFFGFMLASSNENNMVLIFGYLPLTMSMLFFADALVELLYNWLYNLYGADFLSDDSTLGSDYEAQQISNQKSHVEDI